MSREIIGVRQWASALFSGWRVTVSGPPIAEDAEIEMPHGFIASWDSLPGDRVEILVVAEGDEPLTEAYIREHLPAALERAGA